MDGALASRGFLNAQTFVAPRAGSYRRTLGKKRGRGAEICIASSRPTRESQQKTVDKGQLTREDLSPGGVRRKPRRAVDLRKDLHPAPFGGHSISNVPDLMSAGSNSPLAAQARTTFRLGCLSSPSSRNGPEGTAPSSSVNSRTAQARGSSSASAYSPFGIDQTPASFSPRTALRDAREGPRSRSLRHDRGGCPRCDLPWAQANADSRLGDRQAAQTSWSAASCATKTQKSRRGMNRRRLCRTNT